MAFTTSNGQTRSSLAEINITPLVDVVLVLLVIFMITAPVLQSGIEVAVPKTRTVKEIVLLVPTASVSVPDTRSILPATVPV